MDQGRPGSSDDLPPQAAEENLAARTERRKAQDVLWSGSKIDGRVHWSVRECYRLYSPQLKAALRNFYALAELANGLRQPSSPVAALSVQEMALVAEAAFPGHGKLLQALAERPGKRPPQRDAPFRICVRKRPLLEFELEAGEFDSVGVRPLIGDVVCHDGRLHRTGRRITMTHHHFSLDRVWGASTTTEDVYASVAPLVARAASERGLSSTVVCYGQTGTGKTHTMVGLLQRAARDLEGAAVEVVFFEIHGKKCYDLLSGRRQVHLRADASDTVHVRGAKQELLESVRPESLLEVLHGALSLRQVEVTERNPVSSRSHAVCELRVLRRRGVDNEEEGAAGAAGGGVLRFVDLAGSERNYETHAMTAQQHRDSADINTALMALKNCFRAYGTSTRPSFRASRLTQVLKSCFDDAEHRTLVVATVSPSPTDLIHTVNTLTHVSFMAPELASLSRQVAVDLPLVDLGSSAAPAKPIQSWSHEEVCAWVGAAEGGRFAHVALPPGLDGAGLMKLGTLRLAQLFDGDLREARGDNEGSAWTEALVAGPAGGEGSEEGQEIRRREARDTIGRALFAALRRESKRIAAEEGRRRMGPTSAAPGPSSDPLGATGPVRVRTVGGDQVQWWLDDESEDAAAEAAEEAAQLLHMEHPAGEANAEMDPVQA